MDNSIPILKRKSTTSNLYVYFYCTILSIFFTCCYISQAVLYPLSYIPGGFREFYWYYIRCSENSFSRVLVYLISKSGCKQLEITFDSSINLDDLNKLDENGDLLLKFDKRSVWISNHQGYSDWLFMLILFYFSDLASNTVIVLKKSLQNIPVASWSMRLWKFIFVSSSWETDRSPTGKALLELGRRAIKHSRPLALLLYPEGTLVSTLTRPTSLAYAEKKGIKDLKNLLLPKSTGCFFTLRTLASIVPDLSMYDVTIGYPGVPPAGFCQSYYTLRSIFPCQQAPSSVHLHIRRYSLNSIPLGNTKSDLNLTPDQLHELGTNEEKKEFDDWLLERFKEKDSLLDTFYEKGRFDGEEKEGKRLIVKCELKGIDDWLAIGSNLLPPYAVYVLLKYTYRHALTIYTQGGIGLPTLF